MLSSPGLLPPNRAIHHFVMNNTSDFLIKRSRQNPLIILQVQLISTNMMGILFSCQIQTHFVFKIKPFRVQ